MLWRIACAIVKFLPGQFYRRHVGHVFVIDDEIDGAVFKGEPFAVGAGADAAPTAGFGAGDLQCRCADGQVTDDHRG